MAIEYKINKECNHIIEEKGNSFLALRKIQWSKGQERLDLRKWYVDVNGEETIGKGVSFMTEEGPHELVRTMVEQGYGRTQELMDILNRREDTKKDDTSYDEYKETISEDYYNPSEIFE